MSRILLSAAMLAVAVFALTQSAEAQFHRGKNGAGFAKPYYGALPYYGFYSANSYYSYHRPDNLPYFAKHPPVYYSPNIVKRPYGVSPYAAPSGTVPSEFHLMVNEVPSEKIINPYVEPPATKDIEQAPSDAGAVESSQQQGKEIKDGKWQIVPDKKT